MNLLKKIAVSVGIAAICCTMLPSTTVGAAIKSCPPHLFKRKSVERTYVESNSRMFTYFQDVDGDGYDEVVVDACQEVTYEITYGMECQFCHLSYLNQYGGLETTHSEPVKCPEASVG